MWKPTTPSTSTTMRKKYTQRWRKKKLRRSHRRGRIKEQKFNTNNIWIIRRRCKIANKWTQDRQREGERERKRVKKNIQLDSMNKINLNQKFRQKKKTEEEKRTTRKSHHQYSNQHILILCARGIETAKWTCIIIFIWIRIATNDSMMKSKTSANHCDNVTIAAAMTAVTAATSAVIIVLIARPSVLNYTYIILCLIIMFIWR